MLNSTILHNRRIAEGIFEMALRFDAGADDFQPGQFAHVQLPGGGPMLLRRPISVNHVDRAEGSATLVYQVKGDGTKRMSALAAGERLDVLAPLGRGFPRPEGLGRAALVGGGMGAAPLRMLPEAWGDVAFDAYLGFRGAAYAYQTDVFGALVENLHLCSNDGSLGGKTFVTCLLADCPDLACYDAVYACGPTPMLRALKAVLEGVPVPCYVSLEERMGCGVGACLVCSCKVGEGEGWHYRRVCKDGPVFEIGEVDFDA